MAGVSLPGVGPRPDPREASRVRELVRQVTGDDEVTILVTQLACTEPGCPPVETVIALMHAGAPAQYKIHRPLHEVSLDDIARVLSRPERHAH